jgi:hypothetical protein
MLYGVRRGGRLTQVGNHRERQHREYVTHGYLPLLVPNRSAREEIVRVLERKGFWELNCRILPSVPNRWKTDARREPRRNYRYPIFVESPNEADAGFCKRSARVKR